jgi:cell division protein FtsI/penicillin-binding protein 2
MIDENGNTTHLTPQTHRVVSERTAWVMRQILADVVTDGTGIEAKVEGYRVGGKTGTALKLGPDGNYTEATRASFVGMAPIDDPKIVVAVLIDEPAYEFRYGGAAAAPAFAEVMEAALNQMGVIPDAVAG